MATESAFHIDRSGIVELFQSPRGDVYKYMESQAKKVVLLAKRYVGKRTHKLEHSIGYTMYRVGNGVYYTVTARDPISLIQELGSRPHIITPQHGRALRFKSHGRVVYAKVVLHPGTRPTRFLTRALREVVQ